MYRPQICPSDEKRDDLLGGKARQWHVRGTEICWRHRRSSRREPVLPCNRIANAIRCNVVPTCRCPNRVFGMCGGGKRVCRYVGDQWSAERPLRIDYDRFLWPKRVPEYCFVIVVKLD